MKKSIVLAILGTAVVGLTASYGQGTITFSNYGSSSALITYANSNVPLGKAGLLVGSEFSAELAYYNGTTANSALLSLVPGSITSIGFAPGSYPAVDGQASYGAGVFEGPGTLGLTSTTTGEVVTVEVFAFNNGSLGAATIYGNSGLFNVTLGGGLTFPAKIVGTPGASFTVAGVPEPTTMALGGLGLAALMLFRRKRA